MQALRTETVMESERVDGRNHGVITPACSQVQKKHSHKDRLSDMLSVVAFPSKSLCAFV